MSIGIDSILNSFWKNYKPQNNNQRKSKTQISSDIYSQASALVNEYKEKQAESKKNGTKLKSNNIFSDFNAIANMSTSDFLKYAYENKSNSGFEENPNESLNVELPALVQYGARVVSTGGKSFMQVVASIAALYPMDDEIEIAATLLAEYGKAPDTTDSSDNNSNNKVAGKNINFSA